MGELNWGQILGLPGEPAEDSDGGSTGPPAWVVARHKATLTKEEKQKQRCKGCHHRRMIHWNNRGRCRARPMTDLSITRCKCQRFEEPDELQGETEPEGPEGPHTGPDAPAVPGDLRKENGC